MGKKQKKQKLPHDEEKQAQSRQQQSIQKVRIVQHQSNDYLSSQIIIQIPNKKEEVQQPAKESGKRKDKLIAPKDNFERKKDDRRHDKKRKKKKNQMKQELARQIQEKRWITSERDQNSERSSPSVLVPTQLNQQIKKLQQQNQGLKARLVQLKEKFWEEKQQILQRCEKQKAAIKQPLLNKIQLLQQEVNEKQKALKAVPASNHQHIKMIEAQEQEIDQLKKRIQELQQINKKLQQELRSQQPLEQISHIRIGQISPHPDFRLNQSSASNIQRRN